MVILIFFLAHWFLSLFFHTVFLHRYASHRMFVMNKFWERVHYLLTLITLGSSYLVPRAYAVLHRSHHAYSDTAKDPHSPHFFRDVFQMMWNTKKIYADYVYKRVRPEHRFEGNYPEWDAIDRIGDSWIWRIGMGAAYTLFYIFFATQWWMFLLLPVHYMMGPIQGAMVNWLGHKYGYANFDNGDRSKNTTPWGIVMLGELFQNNHHKFPQSPRFAKRWFEFDPTYYALVVMSWLRIIRFA
ncbi:MAG: fatty acid desaturase [Chitinophagales bacterium]|nr:MAG: fatty acid desaturase [Chitinophagales bacterium]